MKTFVVATAATVSLAFAAMLYAQTNVTTTSTAAVKKAPAAARKMSTQAAEGVTTGPKAENDPSLCVP
jgi:hypothetical protein